MVVQVEDLFDFTRLDSVDVLSYNLVIILFLQRHGRHFIAGEVLIAGDRHAALHDGHPGSERIHHHIY